MPGLPKAIKRYVFENFHRASHDPGRDKPCPYKQMQHSDFQFATDAPDIDQPMALQFRDGTQTIPGWMVAHLGGPANVISVLSGYAATVTFEQFTGEFFQEASSIELRRFHTMLIQEFLNRRD